MTTLLFFLLWQTSRQVCQAAALAGQVHECVTLLAQLVGTGDFVTIPRATYQRLLAEARELALLQSEIAPVVESLNHSSDVIENSLIH